MTHIRLLHRYIAPLAGLFFWCTCSEPAVPRVLFGESEAYLNSRQMLLLGESGSPFSRSMDPAAIKAYFSDRRSVEMMLDISPQARFDRLDKFWKIISDVHGEYPIGQIHICQGGQCFAKCSPLSGAPTRILRVGHPPPLEEGGGNKVTIVGNFDRPVGYTVQRLGTLEACELRFLASAVFF